MRPGFRLGFSPDAARERRRHVTLAPSSSLFFLFFFSLFGIVSAGAVSFVFPWWRWRFFGPEFEEEKWECGSFVVLFFSFSCGVVFLGAETTPRRFSSLLRPYTSDRHPIPAFQRKASVSYSAIVGSIAAWLGVVCSKAAVSLQFSAFLFILIPQVVI